jgi:hypothetical protein
LPTKNIAIIGLDETMRYDISRPGILNWHDFNLSVGSSALDLIGALCDVS